MRRAAALALPLLPALAAWLVPSFEAAFVLGMLAFAGGLFLLLRRDRAPAAVLAVALLTLPATAGLRIQRFAGSFEPFSAWIGLTDDLTTLTLPIASEGTFDPNRPPREIVNLDRYGQVWVHGKCLTLARLEEMLAARRGTPVLLRADKDMPFQLLAWILQAARAAGNTDVRVAAAKFANAAYLPEEARALGATSYRGRWPDVEFTLPLGREAKGPRVRIVATHEQTGAWGPLKAWSKVSKPTAVRYELEGRKAKDFAELARWLEDTPPATIDATNKVPLKYVVAVLNAAMRAGHPVPALREVDPPDAGTREAESLPYPAKR